MTLTQLEKRVEMLEKKLARLTGHADPVPSTDINGWIDQIHGTFRDDATYRRAARLGHEWRKSQSGPARSRSKRNAGA